MPPVEDRRMSDYLYIRSHGPGLPGNTGVVETPGWIVESRWSVVAGAGGAQ